MKPVTIYTWTTCPYCLRAKRLLDAKGVDYNEIIIDGDRDTLLELKIETGSGTVPQIFIDDQYVGGCDTIHALESQGKLDELLNG